MNCVSSRMPRRSAATRMPSKLPVAASAPAFHKVPLAAITAAVASPITKLRIISSLASESAKHDRPGPEPNDGNPKRGHSFHIIPPDTRQTPTHLEGYKPGSRRRFGEHAPQRRATSHRIAGLPSRANHLSRPVMSISPMRVGVAPVGAVVFVIGSAISPVGGNPVHLGGNRCTRCPPPAAPIPAAPNRRASRLDRDDDRRSRNHSHRRRRYFCRRRSLCGGWRRWRRRIKVSSPGRSQNCSERDDCGCGRDSNVTHDFLSHHSDDTTRLPPDYIQQHLNAGSV